MTGTEGGARPLRAPRGRARGARIPMPVAVLAGLAIALVTAPLLALVVQAPWSRLVEIVSGSAAVAALAMSLGTAAVSTLLSLLLGVPLALVLADGRRVERPSRARRAVRALITVPVVLPPVAGGVALLALLGPQGLLGAPLLDTTGIAIAPSIAAVVLAQTFVAMPFLVFAAEGAVRGADRRTELAAASLGASPLRVLVRVTLPLAGPGIAAGAALCFARALGEYGATVTFASSVPGVTRTLPMAIYEQLPDDRPAAIALSLLLVGLSVVVLIALRDRWTPGLRA